MTSVFSSYSFEGRNVAVVGFYTVPNLPRKPKKLPEDLVSGATASCLVDNGFQEWVGWRNVAASQGSRTSQGCPQWSLRMSTWLIAEGFSPGMESSWLRALAAEQRNSHILLQDVEKLGRQSQGKKMGCVTFSKERGGASDPFKYLYCRRQVLFFFSWNCILVFSVIGGTHGTYTPLLINKC